MKKPPDHLSEPRIWLKFTLVGVLALSVLGWLSWDTYTDYLYAETQLPKLDRMETVRDGIVHLDEVLTMSARMAAQSGDPVWETRYHESEPQLDKYIKEALQLDPDASHVEAFKKSDAANVALIGMEHHAFELVRQGKRVEAQRLLSSGEYVTQKRIYAAGMTEFSAYLLQTSDSVHMEMLADLLQNAITTFVSALLLILGSFFAYWVSRQRQNVMVENNELLNQKTAELEKLNEQLDGKVMERTSELKESVLATLNMMEDAVLARDGLETVNKQLRREIVERERVEADRQHREAELAESQRITRIGNWEFTPDAGVITWSEGLNLILAHDIGSPAPTFEALQQFYTPESWQRLSAGIARTIDTGEPYDLELEMIRADGAACWTSTHGEAVHGTDGTVEKLRGTVQDITERRKSEASIKYLNRVLSVLSGINTLIVRVLDRDELFRESCRVAIGAGGFRMAMICIVDRYTKKIAPIASAGKDRELMDLIKDRLSSSEDASSTMVGLAMSKKQAVVSNNSMNDPRVVFTKIYAESGIRSFVVLPLIVSDVAVGTISLYASEVNFFQKAEMKLLNELAGDIAYAIDHIDKQERLNYLAYYDVLTGLANRTLFFERAAQYIHSATSGGHKLAIGLIDLERFKNINDSLGRPAGDSLLKQVAERLTQFARNTNLLARIDADHFAFVVPEVNSDGNLAKLVENLMVVFLEHSFLLNDSMFRIGIKAGIALFPDDGDDAESLFRNAEAALNKAKASGDRFLFYKLEMNEAVAGKLAMENQLRQAIENEEFVLHYQPKVNLVSGKITGAEALIRWNDPRTGLVPPGKFIPILEETGLIYEVGRWALRQAITDYLRWQVAGMPAMRIAVNVSPLQLRNINFIDEVRQVTFLDADAAAGMELEITESLIMEDVEHSITSLQAIRAMGVTIAIDDFGTGFSSLSYLAKLPVDTLKIDRAFIIEMDQPEGMALVSTIIILAHALKLKVVAEGVETEKQSRQLLSLNCDEMQGYLFSKPVPTEIFETRFLAPLKQGGKQ
jgi:diguanylate cyclase (GGDEF)-like protein